MTTTPNALGLTRPWIRTRPRSTRALRIDPLAWSAMAILLGAGFTAIVLLTDWFPKGYRAGALGTEVNAIDGGIAVLVAYLSHGRFVRDHRVRHRLIGHGLAVLGTASLVLPAVQVAAPDIPAAWASAALRLLGTAFVLAGAVSGDLVVRAMPRRGVGLIVPAAALMIVLVGAAAWAHRLPAAVAPLKASGTGALTFTSNPFFAAIQLVSAAALLVAALALTRFAVVHPTDLAGPMGPAFALAAFAMFQYVLFPTLTTGWIYSGDVLRTGCYVLLLVAAAVEIRRYWSGQSRAAVLADRRRLAREIHDGVVQEISYIRMESRSLPEHDGVDRIVDACDRALDEARDAVHALALSDDEPLEHLLQRAAHDLSRRYRIDVVLQLEADARPDADQRHGLVRIVREAIANAARHGAARRVTVNLAEHEPGWSLEVRDDGRGFDLAAIEATAGGYGLISMRERADALPGRCVVTSEPGAGTIVKVMW